MNLMPSLLPKKQFDLDLWLCAALMFVQPLTNVAIKYGSLRFDLARFILLLCLARLGYMLLFPGVFKKVAAGPVFKKNMLMFGLVAYTVCMTILQPAFTSDLGFVSVAKINTFIINRGSKYLSYLALSIYVAIVLREPRKIYIGICALAAGLSLLEVLGLLQSVTFTISGIDLFPIKRFAEVNGVTQVRDLSVPVNVLGLRMLRINSLAHEPKGLALFMVFLFALKLYWASCRKLLQFHTFKWLDSYMIKTLWLTIAVIFMTFSGGGIVALAAVVVLAFLFELRNHKGIIKFRSSFLKSLILPLLILLPFILIYLIYSNGLLDILNSVLGNSLFRRTGALETSQSLDALYITLDPEDGALLYNFVNYPKVLLHGLGFGGFSSLSMDFFIRYFSHFSDSPFSRNIVIEIVFSTGIIGLIGTLLFFYSINFQYFKGKSMLSPLYPFLNIVIIVNVLVRSSESLFFVILGLLVGVSLCDRYLLSYAKAVSTQSFLQSKLSPRVSVIPSR